MGVVEFFFEQRRRFGPFSIVEQGLGLAGGCLFRLSFCSRPGGELIFESGAEVVSSFRHSTILGFQACLFRYGRCFFESCESIFKFAVFLRGFGGCQSLAELFSGGSFRESFFNGRREPESFGVVRICGEDFIFEFLEGFLVLSVIRQLFCFGECALDFRPGKCLFVVFLFGIYFQAQFLGVPALGIEGEHFVSGPPCGFEVVFFEALQRLGFQLIQLPLYLSQFGFPFSRGFLALPECKAVFGPGVIGGLFEDLINEFDRLVILFFLCQLFCFGQFAADSFFFCFLFFLCLESGQFGLHGYDFVFEFECFFVSRIVFENTLKDLFSIFDQAL